MSRFLDQIDVLAKQLQGMQPLTRENQQRLEKKIRLEFNYNSNHIEGNTLTYSETELLLIFDDTRGGHTMREYDEMRAHDVAYRMIEEWAIDKEHSLSEQNIKNLNEIILVRPFWKDAITPDGQGTKRLIKIGNYKEHPNSVRLQNGEIFHYASPTDTPILMNELIDWYRSEEKSLHPVTLSAMLHYKFVCIHPFDDGNGRVARLLMNYVLLRNGYPPVIIKSADKGNYLRVLHLADVGDQEPLITYVADQLIWSLQISIRAARGESIDELGDLDKKVKALKQRLNVSDDTKVRVFKNEDSIKLAYQASVFPLISSITDKFSELSPLFKSTDEKLHIVGSGSRVYTMSKDPNTFGEELKRITSSVLEIVYEYRFKNLLATKKVSFSTSVEIRFVLHKNVFELESKCVQSPISKLYDDKYTEEEIKKLVEEIGSFVVEKIDQALDQQNS